MNGYTALNTAPIESIFHFDFMHYAIQGVYFKGDADPWWVQRDIKAALGFTTIDGDLPVNGGPHTREYVYLTRPRAEEMGNYTKYGVVVRPTLEILVALEDIGTSRALALKKTLGTFLGHCKPKSSAGTIDSHDNTVVVRVGDGYNKGFALKVHIDKENDSAWWDIEDIRTATNAKVKTKQLASLLENNNLGVRMHWDDGMYFAHSVDIVHLADLMDFPDYKKFEKVLDVIQSISGDVQGINTRSKGVATVKPGVAPKPEPVREKEDIFSASEAWEKSLKEVEVLRSKIDKNTNILDESYKMYMRRLAETEKLREKFEKLLESLKAGKPTVIRRVPVTDAD